MLGGENRCPYARDDMVDDMIAADEGCEPALFVPEQSALPEEPIDRTLVRLPGVTVADLGLEEGGVDILDALGRLCGRSASR